MIYRGQVTTFAGNGTSATADGTVLEAGFFWPLDVALDGAGKLYVVSEGLSKLRMIERGYVRTLDVDVYPQEVSTDPMGNLFIVDSPRDRVSLVKENKALPIIDGFVEQWRNGPLAKATPGAIGGMAVDGKGRIYLVDGQNHVIRLIVR
jgi:DNA-binding beta-propeller fold protein YncE